MTSLSESPLVGRQTFPLGEVARKRCSMCRGLKVLDAFAKNARAADGHHHYCRPCQSEYNRKYYADRAARWAIPGPVTPAVSQQAQAKEKRVRMSEKNTGNNKKKARRTGPNTATAVWVSVRARRALETLKATVGFPTLSETIEFALDVAASNGAAIKMEKAKAEVARLKADLAAAEKNAKDVLAEVAPLALVAHGEAPVTTKGESAKRKIVQTNGHAPACSVRSCERPARGGFKLCLHHRRVAREQNRARAAKKKRELARQAAREFVENHQAAGADELQPA